LHPFSAYFHLSLMHPYLITIVNARTNGSPCYFKQLTIDNVSMCLFNKHNLLAYGCHVNQQN